MEIKTYAAEASLKEQIESSNSISFVTKVEPLDEKFIAEAGLKLLPAKTSNSKSFEVKHELLYPTKSILVTSNWNKNDDIFGVAEIWEARKTAIDTPTNIDHDHQKIVGHITDIWVLDAEGNLISDDTDIDDLPELIHICNSAVIYRFYKDEDLQNRADELIEQIEAGEKYVSQECLFSDFDYALIDANGKHYTVSRNEDTAFLTKHLRRYGGTGKYDDYKIGRFLRKLVFSGKGYVDKPANPDSIIFEDENPFLFQEESCYKNIDEIKNNGVVKIITENISMANENLQTQIDSLAAELSKAKADNDKLRDQMSEANVKQVKDENDKLSTSLVEANEKITTVSDELTSVKAQLDEATSKLEEAGAKIEELTKVNDELTQEIAKSAAEKRTNDRVATLVDAGISREDAEVKVAKFESLDDEQFAVISETLTEAAKMADEKKKKKGDMKNSADCSVETDTEALDTVEVEEANAGAISDEVVDDDADSLRLAIAKLINPNFEGDE